MFLIWLKIIQSGPPGEDFWCLQCLWRRAALLMFSFQLAEGDEGNFSSECFSWRLSALSHDPTEVCFFVSLFCTIDVQCESYGVSELFITIFIIVWVKRTLVWNVFSPDVCVIIRVLVSLVDSTGDCIWSVYFCVLLMEARSSWLLTFSFLWATGSVKTPRRCHWRRASALRSLFDSVKECVEAERPETKRWPPVDQRARVMSAPLRWQIQLYHMKLLLNIKPIKHLFESEDL